MEYLTSIGWGTFALFNAFEMLDIFDRNDYEMTDLLPSATNGNLFMNIYDICTMPGRLAGYMGRAGLDFISECYQSIKDSD